MTQTGVRWLLGLLFVLTSQAMENHEDVYAQDDEWLQRPMDYEIKIDERFDEENWQDESGKVYPGGIYKFQHLSANGSPVFKSPEFTMWRGNTVIRDQDQRDRSFNDAGTWYWAPNSIVKTAEREGETVRLIGDLEGHENNEKSIYRWIGLNVVTPITGSISDGSMWKHYTRLDEYDDEGRRTRRSWEGLFLNNMIVRARRETGCGSRSQIVRRAQRNPREETRRKHKPRETSVTFVKQTVQRQPSPHADT